MYYYEPSIPMQPRMNGATATLPECRTENQRWSAVFSNYEQEIDQLLELLADVLERYNYKSLRHRAIDYYADLNQLKGRLVRLRTGLVCQRSCAASQPENAVTTCTEPQFGQYHLIQPYFTKLSNDYNHLKDNCYQFLSVMVQLNLM